MAFLNYCWVNRLRKYNAVERADFGEGVCHCTSVGSSYYWPSYLFGGCHNPGFLGMPSRFFFWNFGDFTFAELTCRSVLGYE